MTVGEKIDQYLQFREKLDALHLTMHTIQMYITIPAPTGIICYRDKILTMLDNFETQSEGLYNFIKDNPDISTENTTAFIDNCHVLVKQIRAAVTKPMSFHIPDEG